ncbi:MAG: hypothetical protein JXA22_10420 [Candidatus Thermoplasmatota archaeon]|nr:hypothetical protein [Candidatus Thermoplasmatota archaeon]
MVPERTSGDPLKTVRRTLLITAAILVLISFPIGWDRAQAQLSTVLVFDLEEDDGGFIHGGAGDQWEWGSPGPGSPENPGPDRAGDGSKVWGCPLNGTYLNGTSAYLRSPELDTSSFNGLEISFLYWMDLTLMEDEEEESGDILGSDLCYLQISIDAGDWIEVVEYNGSRTGTWKEDILVLGNELGDTLVLRFLLVDHPDGHCDNGFMVDSIRISAEEKPQVSISLGADAYMPPVVARGEAVLITFQVIDEGLTVPEDTYVTVYVESSGQDFEFYYRSEVTGGSIQRRFVEWYPSSSGSFRGWINLTVEGNYQEGRSFNMRSFSPIYYDDSSIGTSHLNVQNGIADAVWNTITPPLTGFSMSGGEVLWYGSETGDRDGSAGFNGPTWAYIETGWIDLTYYTDSFLYLYHRYSFLGPKGTCGGVVEAMTEEGDWVVLEPLGFTYGKLNENISGPMSGSEAIVGTDEWGVDGFELLPFTGGSTRIRLSVVANDQGHGEGWFLDDMMVVGEGYDPFDTEPPAPVETIWIEVVDEGAVSLSWTPSNARDLKQYNIYLELFDFQDLSGLSPYLEVVDPGEESIVIADLDPLLNYWTAVTAVDIIGNEDQDVRTVMFKPTSIEDNMPPTADIRIEGGYYTRSVGEDIRFDGTGSSDPENDPMTYFWTMPDGNTYRGATVTWRAEEAGDDLEILLTVKDSGGLSDTASVTIDINEDDAFIYDNADLWPFLLISIPLVLIVLTLVLIATLFRSSARKRLERRLRSLGIDPEGFRSSREVDDREIRGHVADQRKHGPKVHDLVPVWNEEESESVEMIHERKGSKEAGRVDDKDASAKEEERSLKVVIECPFCSEVFKEKIKLDVVRKHQTFTVKCPHCGRSGDITP